MKSIFNNVFVVNNVSDIEKLSDTIIIIQHKYETDYQKTKADLFLNVKEKIIKNFSNIYLYNNSFKIYIHLDEIKTLTINEKTEYEYSLICGTFNIGLFFHKEDMMNSVLSTLKEDGTIEKLEVNTKSPTADIIRCLTEFNESDIQYFISKFNDLNNENFNNKFDSITKFHSNNFSEFFLDYDKSNNSPDNYYFVIKESVHLVIENNKDIVKEIEKIKSNTSFNYFKVIKSDYVMVCHGPASSIRYNFTIDIGLAIDKNVSNEEVIEKYKELNNEKILKHIKYLKKLKINLSKKEKKIIFLQEYIGDFVFILGILFIIAIIFYHIYFKS